MSSDIIWTAIQPAEFISRPFLDNLGTSQTYKQYIADCRGETLVIGIWAVQGTNLDLDEELKLCCDFYGTVSEPKWNITYGYWTYELSYNNHGFTQKFLITRTLVTIFYENTTLN